MTEKRFSLAYENGNWWAVNDSGVILWKEEVIYLLNKQEERIKELEKENDELKKEKENLKKALWESEKSYIEETNEFITDVERGIAWLKEEFEREYWND